MKFCRACILAAAVMLPAANAAQAQAQSTNQEPPCMREFLPLRADVEKKGQALAEANKRRISAKEACQLFRVFTAAEIKLIKYAEENATWCGIPGQAIKQMKDHHAQAMATRARVCKAAANPPPPPGPSLSDALGAGRVPDPENVKPGHGTFDTLIGTPLGNR